MSLLPLLQPRGVRKRHGLGSAPFARHYSGYRFFLSLPPGTKMFQFPGFALTKSVVGLQPTGFPHSDMLGSKPVCSSPSLFAAYHVLPRLRIAKASSVRSLLLSFISCESSQQFLTERRAALAFEIAVPIL